MALSTGLQIGKYELGKKLGQGGFGLVFIARDTSLDREVALKFLHPEHTANPEILRRFLQEARSAARIVHSGIVTVFECGQVAGTGTSSDGVAYIAMELLHGESLTDRLARSGRLVPDVAIEVVRQVASALEAAHRAGIVHRDLKPDNIFLMTDPAMPGGERVKVLDFGIAKLAQAQGSGVQTQSMMVFGTPRYMSPEQCRSAAHIDHRSDIYTLGCILFELVVGAPPFEGEAGELIAKHQLVAPSTARSITGDLPEDLDELISSMLAKDPGQRPQTMIAVQRALEAGGAMAPGVAPTLLPDADEPLPRFTPTPGPLGGKAVQVREDAARARSGRPASSRTAASSAGASPTTLGGASGQWDRGEPPRRGKLPRILVSVAALALAGGGIWFALGRGDDDSTAPRTAQTPPPAGSGEVQPPPVPPPTTPADIELELTSTPKAEIYRAADGLLLGQTPYRNKRPAAEGQLVFILKAKGFQDQRVVMPAHRSDKRDVTLEAVPKAVAIERPAKKPPRPRKPPKPTEPKKPLKIGDLPE